MEKPSKYHVNLVMEIIEAADQGRLGVTKARDNETGEYVTILMIKRSQEGDILEDGEIKMETEGVAILQEYPTDICSRYTPTDAGYIVVKHYNN